MSKSVYAKAMQRRAKENAESVARKMASDEVMRVYTDFCDKTDLTILYTLWDALELPVEKLYYFYERWLNNHADFIRRFRTKDANGNWDDSDYWVMEKRLRDAGLDFDKLKQIGDESQRDFELSMREREDANVQS